MKGLQFYMIVLFVALSSFGAFVRLKLTVTQVGFPWMTLAVNLLGCFLIGALYALKESGVVSYQQWILLGVAMLGALTTFSSFSLDILKLINEKSYLESIGYVFMSNGLGVVLCFIGFRVAGKIVV